MSTHAKPAVCLVDDEPAIRAAMRLSLKAAGIPLVAFASAQEFLAQFDPKNIAAIILDVRMPGMSGLELFEILRQRRLAIPILLLTGHADVPLAVSAVKDGALDVLEKPFKDDVLIERLHQAFALFEKQQARAAETRRVADRLALLTPRELEVLDLMVSGLKNKEIADKLGISPKTLDIHRSKVMEKMAAHTVADLVRWRLLVPAT